MSAIEAASVSVKTMADGTLRITFDVEPANAQMAFAMFGSPGTPAALAALKIGYAAVKDNQPQEKPKGGALARLAGQLCQQESFQAWIGVGNAEWAAEAIREMCQIKSRAELDSNAEAAEIFHRTIRIPYSELMARRGNQ